MFMGLIISIRGLHVFAGFFFSSNFQKYPKWELAGIACSSLNRLFLIPKFKFMKKLILILLLCPFLLKGENIEPVETDYIRVHFNIKGKLQVDWKTLTEFNTSHFFIEVKYLSGVPITNFYKLKGFRTQNVKAQNILNGAVYSIAFTVEHIYPELLVRLIEVDTSGFKDKSDWIMVPNPYTVTENFPTEKEN